MNRHLHRSARKGRGRIFWRSLLIILGLLLCVVIFKAVRVALYLQQSYRTATQFAHFLEANLTAERYALAQSFLADSATALANADQEMGFFRPILQPLDALPVVGPSLAALPTLLTTGSELAQIALTAYPIIQPVLLAPPGTSPIAQLPVAFAAAEPELAEIRARVGQVEQKLRAIDSNRLVPGLQESVAELQAAVALMIPALQIGVHLPDLFGIGRNRTYLVLAQNNHELRATGGFVTAIGRVTVADGRIIGIDFVDSYDRSISRTDLPLPRAPQPVQQYMGIEIMLLRDVRTTDRSHN
jgi:hypothetical protein